MFERCEGKEGGRQKEKRKDGEKKTKGQKGKETEKRGNTDESTKGEKRKEDEMNTRVKNNSR